MEIIYAAVAAISGGALGAGLVWFGAVRPLQKHLRAAHDSQNDVVSLWRRDRKQLEGDVARLAGRAETEAASADTFAMIADLATAQAQFQQRKRRETQRSLELVLAHYGRAVERADEAEGALLREQVVARGLERLVGQERAA